MIHVVFLVKVLLGPASLLNPMIDWTSVFALDITLALEIIFALDITFALDVHLRFSISPSLSTAQLVSDLRARFSIVFVFDLLRLRIEKAAVKTLKELA